MNKKSVVIAAAFLGLVVGAGFASGQEVLQYFVSFGSPGLIAAAISALILAWVGAASLQLGSYFGAKEHSAVFAHISHPVVSRLLDIFLILTLFCMGFVMIAGAGSNLNQQFGLPNWVGAALMSVLVITIGMVDVDKVTRVIGGLTPFMIIFVVIAAVYAFVTADGSVAEMNAVAATMPRSISHWGLSAVNYVSMTFTVAVSMAIVMGGEELDMKVAGRGGVLGGLVFGVLLLLSTAALFFKLPTVKDFDMPNLELINSIHPALGLVMAIVIYAMIFNTAIGIYYAMAKRAEGIKPSYFKPALILFTLGGFGMSFVGFKQLIAVLYPIIGFVGLALIVVLLVGWSRNRAAMHEEESRRQRLYDYVRRLWSRGEKVTATDLDQAKIDLDESVVDNDQLRAQLRETVVNEIVADEATDIDPDTLQQAAIQAEKDPTESIPAVLADYLPESTTS